MFGLNTNKTLGPNPNVKVLYHLVVRRTFVRVTVRMWGGYIALANVTLRSEIFSW